MTVKVRISGTRGEIDGMLKALDGSGVDVLSKSVFHPWKRNDPSSKVGAVYLDALPVEKAAEAKSPPSTMPEGECILCGRRGPLPLLGWADGEYLGYCEGCAKEMVEQQSAGNILKSEDPSAYRAYVERWKHPSLVMYHSGGEWMALQLLRGCDE